MLHPVRLLLILIMVIYLTTPFAAFSQANIQDIPSAQPGAIQRSIQNELSLPEENNTQTIKPTAPHIGAPDDADKYSFQLRGVVIKGSTVFDVRELADLYKDLLGTEITLDKVYDMSTKVTKMYQEKGYLLSFAVVPEQKVMDGYIEIDVVEGFIEKVDFEGDIRGLNALSKHWTKAITRSRPVKSTLIEKISLYLNDLPGKTVTSYLEASEDVEGASILRFKIEHDYTSMSAEVNNFGTRFIGPFQQQLGVTFNSLIGLNESITIRELTSINPIEMNYKGINIDLPITSYGTTLGIAASRNESHPGYTLRLSDVRSNSSSGSISIRQPIIRTQKENLYFTTTFDMYNSEVITLGSIISADSIRSLRLKAELDAPDRWGGKNYIAFETSFGLGFLGAKRTGERNLSRSKGRTDYKKMTLNFIRNVKLPNNFNMLTSLTAQYAGGFQMLSSEEFGFGGRSFGRGYDSSEITGDNGLAAAIEISYSNYAWEPIRPLINTYQLYAFYDLGITWKNDTSLQNDKKTAASGGAGVRLGIFNNTSSSIEFAKPLSRPASSRGTKDQNDIQLLFNMKSNF